MRKGILAAKIALALGAVAPIAITPAMANWPVIDVTNISQTTVSAVKNAASVAKQIQQYETQLQQYQNMLQNTLAPAAYVWSQAQNTMNGLQNSLNSLNFLSQQSGGIDNYLNQFKNPNYYSSSPCFSASGCTDAQRTAIQSQQQAKQALQMATNDSVLRGINQQQQQLKTEASTLEQMQRNAQGAQGQAQALGYANQFAANQANQLMQIRSLLMQQQAAATALQQANADQAALEDAASKEARSGTYSKSSSSAFAYSTPN